MLVKKKKVLKKTKPIQRSNDDKSKSRSVSCNRSK